MSCLFTFALNRDDLDGIVFVVERNRLPEPCDIEGAVLEDARDIVRHPPRTSLTDAIHEAARGAEIVAVIRNPRLVLDTGLPARISAVADDLRAAGNWAVATADGVGRDGRRLSALYASSTPALPSSRSSWPITDTRPDFYLIDAAFARECLASGDLPGAAFETILVTQGYRMGRLSLFVPRLWAGIDGGTVPIEHARRSDALEKHRDGQIQPRTGPVEDAGTAGPTSDVDQVLASWRPCLTLSIVIRTRFARPHLLDRLLTSLWRARHPNIEVDVILSTDTPGAAAEMEELTPRFRGLNLSLKQNRSDAPSRVANLLGGLAAATGDYVCFVDDDDHLDLFALTTLSQALFADNRPIVAVTSEVRSETWTPTPSGRWVLERAETTGSYDASGWRDMFTGVNRMPICGLILPRDWLSRRITGWAPRHDLSEDYAMFLHALTAPDLPEIVEAEGPFCYISLRDGENSVGVSDRRPWVRDIAGHLADLGDAPGAAGDGLWQLLTTARHARPDPAVAELEKACARMRAELRLARRENAHLRALVQRSGALTG